MNIASNWRITLDPAGAATVLLAYDQELADEVSFSWTRGVGVEPLVRSAAPHLEDAQNVYAVLSYEVFVDDSTDASSRRSMMLTALTALAAADKPLKIECLGGTHYWTFSSALVSNYSPSKSEQDGAPARHSRVWEITAAGLTETAI